MKRIKEIIREFKSGESPRAFLISTDDKGLLTFLIEEFKCGVSSRYGEVEVIRFESPESAIESARSFFLLSKPRIIISEIKEKEIEILKDKLYVAGNTFILFSSDFIPFKELLSIKTIPVFSIKEVDGSDLRDVIEEYISSMGYKITKEAIDLLLSFYNGNFGEILNEVKKLMSYVGEKKEIAQKDVLEGIVGLSKEVNPEEVFLALIRGDKKRLFQMTTSLKEQAKKNDDLWILLIGYINSRLKTLLYIKEKMKTEKLKEDSLHTFAIRLRYQKIYELFDILREYDIPIKYGYIPRHILFERLVLSVFSAMGTL